MSQWSDHNQPPVDDDALSVGLSPFNKRIRKMQRRLQDEEMKILRGEVAITDGDAEEEDYITDGGYSSQQSTMKSTRRRSIVELESPKNISGSAEKNVQGTLEVNDDESEDEFSDLTEASEDSDTHVSVNDGYNLEEDDLIEEDDEADILSDAEDLTSDGSDNEF